ncbi:MAG: hypothetical protein ACPGUV_12645 [Polyangiales bacterium]
MKLASGSDFPPSCVRDERGTATVEYVIVLSLVTLPGAILTAALGLTLLRSYLFTRLLLLLPIP